MKTRYYIVVQRGHLYRVGRRRWWGWQWSLQFGYDYCRPFVSADYHKAVKHCEEVNDSIDLWARYEKDDWKVA